MFINKHNFNEQNIIFICCPDLTKIPLHKRESMLRLVEQPYASLIHKLVIYMRLDNKCVSSGGIHWLELPHTHFFFKKKMAEKKKKNKHTQKKKKIFLNHNQFTLIETLFNLS